MLSFEILCVGRLKKGPMHDLMHHYTKQIRWPLRTYELESKHTDSGAMNRDEHQKIEALIKPNAFVIMMDERGKSLSSRAFSTQIQRLQDDGAPCVQIVLGGADGLSDALRKRANMLLSFGAQTWPHMLARVMLYEQIYRAQQIIGGHPYHRD